MSRILLAIEKKDGGHNIVVDKLPTFLYELVNEGRGLLAKSGGFADFLYHSKDSQQSFAGRELIFPLKDGGEVKSDGVWWQGTANAIEPQSYKQVAVIDFERFKLGSTTYFGMELNIEHFEQFLVEAQKVTDEMTEKMFISNQLIDARDKEMIEGQGLGLPLELLKNKVTSEKPLSKNQLRKMEDKSNHYTYLKEGYRWNPYASYPRNSDCPCGSQRKFKNCHRTQLKSTVLEADYQEMKTFVDYVKSKPNIKFVKQEAEATNDSINDQPSQ